MEKRWPAAVQIHRGAPAQRILRRRRRRHRHRDAGRHVQHHAARARAARPRRRVRRQHDPALRAERHLSADRQRVRPLLRRQEGDPDHRGRPAGLHRAGRQHHPAPRRHPDPGRTARTCCRWPANTPAAWCATGMRKFIATLSAGSARRGGRASRRCRCRTTGSRRQGRSAVAGKVHGRPPSFCTGCPERPIFAAMKLVERELGTHHVSCRHRLPPVLDLAAVQSRRHHDGLWPRRRRRRRRSTSKAGKRAIALMGDGGFWHNGLDQRRRQRRLQQERQRPDHRRQRLFGRDRRPGHALLVASQQPCAQHQDIRSRRRCAASASPGCSTITRTYDVAMMRDTLREALTTNGEGPEGHHRAVRMHAEQAAPRAAADAQGASKRGERVVRERFGVDADTCTGDHSCIRLSGCPSLTIAPNPDPLRARAGDQGDQLLRRLRPVRRGRARRGAVPVVLPRLDHHQPDRLGPASRRKRARRRDRLLPARAIARRTPRRRALSRSDDADGRQRQGAADHHRHPRHGRRRRRRAGGLDRRCRRARRLHRADDLGARRRAAHRRDRSITSSCSPSAAAQADGARPGAGADAGAGRRRHRASRPS